MATWNAIRIVTASGLLAMQALAAAPKVMNTAPASDAINVDPATTEITVTFDMAMKQNGWSLVFVDDTTFPDLAGDDAISFRDERTCVIRVKLQPDTGYGVAFNSATRQGFKSAEDATPAQPYTLRFKTGNSTPASPPDGPRVVRTDPADKTENLEAGTYDLTIVFSEPMKPGQASITTPQDGPHLKLIGKPAWKDTRTFVAPIQLEPGTSYRVGINSGDSKRFVSAGDDTPALPVEFSFSTAGGVTSAPASRPARAKTEPAGPIQLRYGYRPGLKANLTQSVKLDLQLNVSTGQQVTMAQASSVTAAEEVLAVEKGKPTEVRRTISEYHMSAVNPETGEKQSSPPLSAPVMVKLIRQGDEVEVQAEQGDVPDPLMGLLSEDTFLDLLPREAITVGKTCKPPPETLAEIKEAFDTGGQGNIDLTLTCKRIGDHNAKEAGQAIRVAEFDINWRQTGTMENDIPFTLTGKGEVIFAIDLGVFLKIAAEGKFDIRHQATDENGQTVRLTGGGKYQTAHLYEPVGSAPSRPSPSPPEPAHVEPEQPSQDSASPQGQAPTDPTATESEAAVRPGPDPNASDGAVAGGWSRIKDPLFGSEIEVPPGWTPRVRGDVALCIEPDELNHASAFMVPTFLRGQATPAQLADSFDQNLSRLLPTWKTQTTGQPTADSVQRSLQVELGGTAVSGSYRAVVSKSGTGFVMGYLAPADRVRQLEPTFFRILKNYRYHGPSMRLQPFKSAAVELKVPPGWQVRTSEGDGTADQDIDWEVTCPQVPGARAFMYSPKFFTSNWISDVMTGQVDPQLLALWQNRGCTMANFTGDEQALQTALAGVLPNLQIVRQNNMDELRAALEQLMQIPMQTLASTGGRFTVHVYELLGRRNVDGVEMRFVIWPGMATTIVQGGIKGTLGLWITGIRGFEAPAEKFAELAPMLDRVATSFTYTTWWIRTVMKANEEQANTMRKLYADMARMDREIWENRSQTNSAIQEMMYDTLTENYGYVNEKTGTIEKIPADRIDRFRKEGGEIGSPEEIIEHNVSLRDATPLREAGADDYMSFDRRVHVWP